MKLIKQANGKTTVKMSQKEWMSVGEKAGWMKEADLDIEMQRQTAFDYFTQIKNLGLYSQTGDHGQKLYDLAADELRKFDFDIKYLENPNQIKRIWIKELGAYGTIKRLYEFGREFMEKHFQQIQELQRNRNPEWDESGDEQSKQDIINRSKQRQETGEPVLAPGANPFGSGLKVKPIQ